MTRLETLRYNAVLNLMKKYRALYNDMKVTKEPRPMNDARVKEILCLPSRELVGLCMDMANLTVNETQAINYCVRLGYTQEEAADIMERSRNSVQSWYKSGMAKLRTA